MIKFRTYCFTLILICLCLLPLRAEARQYYNGLPSSSIEVSWGLSIPIVQSSFWQVDPNPVGTSAFSLRYEYRLLPALGLGFKAGLDYRFYEGYTNESHNSGSVTVIYSGESTREQILVPLLLSARYYPLGDRETLLRPYVGLGIGTAYNKMFITGDTINTTHHANWGFALSPELGTRMHILSEFFVDLKCSALWVTDAIDATDAMYEFIGGGNKNTFSIYPQIGVGFAF